MGFYFCFKYMPLHDAVMRVVGIAIVVRVAHSSVLTACIGQCIEFFIRKVETRIAGGRNDLIQPQPMPILHTLLRAGTAQKSIEKVRFCDKMLRDAPQIYAHIGPARPRRLAVGICNRISRCFNDFPLQTGTHGCRIGDQMFRAEIALVERFVDVLQMQFGESLQLTVYGSFHIAMVRTAREQQRCCNEKKSRPCYFYFTQHRYSL